MDPGAHRIGRQGQVVAEAVGEVGREGGKARRPGPAQGDQFSLELQEPGPAIGALEPAGGGTAQEGALPLHSSFREGLHETGVDFCGDGVVRKPAADGGE